MSLDFHNQSFAMTTDALADPIDTPSPDAPSSTAPRKAASGQPVLRLDGAVTDADMLVEVTGLPGVTHATYSDAARLVHNLRERDLSALEVQWLLEVLEAAHDRLHPGPMLANPFVLIRVSLAVNGAKRALQRTSRAQRSQPRKKPRKSSRRPDRYCRAKR